MHSYIIHFCIILTLYIISAYATTDISRLIKGYDISILSSKCICPTCNNTIPLKMQIPIFSYIFCGGKCYFCSSSIPRLDFFIELFLFSSMTFISVLTDFSYMSYCLILILYMCTKLIIIIKYGPRKNAFIKSLLYSTASNIIVFAFLAVEFFIKQLVCS